MIPTFRFYLFLMLGGAIAVWMAIVFSQAAALRVLLLYDLGLLILGFIDAYRVKFHRVEVSRSPLARLSIGQDNPVELILKNQQYPAQVWLKDDYPVNFSVSVTELKASLAPHGEQTLTYAVYPQQRGQYEWKDLHLRQLGRWGLAWQGWKVSASQSVAVYPDLLSLRSLSIRLTLESSGTMRQARRIGLGTEFAELREYQHGDDLRYMDWKATARRQRPLVRVLEPDREQTVMILLDRGRLMTAQVQGLKRFDWGLNTALSLALTALHRGDRVGIGVFDRDITAWIAPERGQHHLSHLIERLTPIQPVLLEPDYLGAVSKVVNQQTRRALIVLITDIVDQTASAELLGAMMRLTPRYLPFCIALRDPQIDTLAAGSSSLVASNPDTRIQAAYTRAVAIDLLAQRQVAFAQLKQRGVLVLDAPAHQMSNQLVERYLQLKAKNLL
ncbi:MAG: DUF58 domain-containing protein [Snowella sp.]|nr:DUF58 domain-containing protein [Snowella sp.]